MLCTTDDIEASHPLPSRSSHQQPAVIVRFRFKSRKTRDEVLRTRKNLKGTNVSISDDLSLNRQLLNRLKNSDKIKICWTWNGRVFRIGTESGNKCLFKPFCSILFFRNKLSTSLHEIIYYILYKFSTCLHKIIDWD